MAGDILIRMGILAVGLGLVIIAIGIAQMVFKFAIFEIEKSTTKTIVFWILILASAVLLYQIVQRNSSVGAVRPQVSAPNHMEYLVVPVGPSVDDVRAALESRANAGWEFTAPVTNNGTTTALIFKRQRK
jgi:hypothetical protein